MRIVAVGSGPTSRGSKQALLGFEACLLPQDVGPLPTATFFHEHHTPSNQLALAEPGGQPGDAGGEAVYPTQTN